MQGGVEERREGEKGRRGEKLRGQGGEGREEEGRGGECKRAKGKGSRRSACVGPGLATSARDNEKGQRGEQERGVLRAPVSTPGSDSLVGMGQRKQWRRPEIGLEADTWNPHASKGFSSSVSFITHEADAWYHHQDSTK